MRARWYVWRMPLDYAGPRHWLASSLDGTWRDFPTWAEALAYALSDDDEKGQN